MKRDEAAVRATRHALWIRTTNACLAAIALTVYAGGTAQAEDACQPIRDAIAKLNAATQFQQKGIITELDGGKSYSLDYVVSAGKEYSRRDGGSWRIGSRQAVPLIVDGKPAVYECSRTGTGSLGEAVTVIYQYKRLTADHRVRDVKAWIAEGTGEPLQTEMIIETEPNRKATFTFSYNQQADLPAVDGQ
ncbi:hypothetical protein [Rhizobium sp. BR 315]|uniref:hypothetical protein n=1 Tax=Rhizobium sp. BR 315 TaxID=3040014 RepID=UPI003D33E0F4